MTRRSCIPQRTSCGPIEASINDRSSKMNMIIPQRTSCGPIEARPRCTRWSGSASCIPQRTSCGPIEATEEACFLPSQPVDIPQRTSCGPIEAIICYVYGIFIVLPFRNEQVAAPLKPWHELRRPVVPDYIPQRTSCGPIEARTSGLPKPVVLFIPQRTSCGPIEADKA